METWKSASEAEFASDLLCFNGATAIKIRGKISP